MHTEKKEMTVAANEEEEGTALGGLPNGSLETQISSGDDYFVSTCSTPYVSAPSSPGRPTNATAPCFFSAPASPTRFFPSFASSSPSSSLLPPLDSSGDFEFSARIPAVGSDFASMPPATMISADELFFNGQIRPMRSSWKPQKMDPFVTEATGSSDPAFPSGNEDRDLSRDFRSRSRSLHRRTRSLSPLRNAEPSWPHFVQARRDLDEEEEDEQKAADPPPASGVARRSSRRWMSIKEFLYRSKSEGRGYVKEKLKWSALSFSPSKEKKVTALPVPAAEPEKKKKKALAKDGKRRTPAPSVHELHYTAKRAQAEEMKKRTYLPYRQGLLGCLGFSSRSYSMVNGLARTLHHHHHPVPSR